MRICYVCHANSHFAAPYIDYFASRGHEVHLISFHPGSVPGAIMHHPAGRRFNPETDKWPYIWNAPRVTWMIRSIRPDILHAHYLTSNGFLAAASGFHPLVVSARGSDVHGASDRMLTRKVLAYVLRRADLVNPVSAELESIILGLGCDPARMLRLSQGVVPDGYMVDRGDRRAGPLRMICTRPLAAIYQPELILGALAALTGHPTRWEFIFAAAGPLLPVLSRRSAAMRLDSRVRFLGGYPHADLPGLLAAADIFVSASLSDGTSPALLEAMASGAFPVVSDIAANREWLPGRSESMLFDPHSEDDLRRCLGRALKDHALRAAAVAVNRAQVLERGDRLANMGTLAQAYERLVEQRR